MVDFSTQLDDSLVASIAKRTSNESLAKAAWHELYVRHHEWLFRRISRMARFAGRGIGADDIVVETFAEVWMKAARSFLSGQYEDEEDARSHVRSWLAQIGQNLLFNKLKENGYAASSVLPEEYLATQFAHTPSEISDPHFLDMLETTVANCLSEDDRKILWLKMRYYDKETGKSNIPHYVLDAFSKELNISKGLIRKRYERALNAIKHSLTSEELLR